jgi:hypothetical protein
MRLISEMKRRFLLWNGSFNESAIAAQQAETAPKTVESALHYGSLAA